MELLVNEESCELLYLACVALCFVGDNLGTCTEGRLLCCLDVMWQPLLSNQTKIHHARLLRKHYDHPKILVSALQKHLHMCAQDTGLRDWLIDRGWGWRVRVGWGNSTQTLHWVTPASTLDRWATGGKPILQVDRDLWEHEAIWRGSTRRVAWVFGMVGVGLTWDRYEHETVQIQNSGLGADRGAELGWCFSCRSVQELPGFAPQLHGCS